MGVVGPKTVTITLTGRITKPVCRITYNGVTYAGPAVFEAQIGDTILIISDGESRYGDEVYVNNVLVAAGYTPNGINPFTYSYTVVSDAAFRLGGESFSWTVYITDNRS